MSNRNPCRREAAFLRASCANRSTGPAFRVSVAASVERCYREQNHERSNDLAELFGIADWGDAWRGRWGLGAGSASSPIDLARFYKGAWLEVARRPMWITQGCVAEPRAISRRRLK